MELPQDRIHGDGRIWASAQMCLKPTPEFSTMSLFCSLPRKPRLHVDTSRGQLGEEEAPRELRSQEEPDTPSWGDLRRKLDNEMTLPAWFLLGITHALLQGFRAGKTGTSLPAMVEDQQYFSTALPPSSQNTFFPFFYFFHLMSSFHKYLLGPYLLRPKFSSRH